MVRTKNLKHRIEGEQNTPSGKAETTPTENISAEPSEVCPVCGEEYIHHTQPHDSQTASFQTANPACITIEDECVHVFVHNSVDNAKQPTHDSNSRYYPSKKTQSA